MSTDRLWGFIIYPTIGQDGLHILHPGQRSSIRAPRGLGGVKNIYHALFCLLYIETKFKSFCSQSCIFIIIT